MPVTFTSRTLKPNEVNYGVVDKEVLALLRILDFIGYSFNQGVNSAFHVGMASAFPGL